MEFLLDTYSLECSHGHATNTHLHATAPSRSRVPPTQYPDDLQYRGINSGTPPSSDDILLLHGFGRNPFISPQRQLSREREGPKQYLPSLRGSGYNAGPSFTSHSFPSGSVADCFPTLYIQHPHTPTSRLRTLGSYFSTSRFNFLQTK